jgi:hypothetical protein
MIDVLPLAVDLGLGPWPSELKMTTDRLLADAEAHPPLYAGNPEQPLVAEGEFFVGFNTYMAGLTRPTGGQTAELVVVVPVVG